MLTPFYRLVCCRSWGERNLKVVLAASGSFIYCFNQSNGAVLSKWSQASPLGSAPSTESQIVDDESTERPTKRRRTSHGEEEDASDRSPDVITLNDSTEKPRRRKRRTPAQPSVVRLIVAKTGRHVVAVTDDDKSVRVLEMLDGSLRQISERQMPKKPNAICFSPDESTILVGDKFGDVYSIPLLISPNAETAEISVKLDVKNESNGPEVTAETPSAKSYKPSASLKTIHTKQNRIALENQLRSIQAQGAKKGIEFVHKLLLGHVSLLTDIAYVNYDVNGKARGFILTSDRDEKIRVSRGEPQSHIIEGFCLGHGSFVNRILVPPKLPRLLVTGGGDDELYIWDWLKSDLLNKVDLRAIVAGSTPSGQEQKQVGIIGLYAMQTSRTGDNDNTTILVLSETAPYLIALTLHPTGTASNIYSLPLLGNPLDLTIDPDTHSVLISIDPLHDSGTKTISTQHPDLERDQNPGQSQTQDASSAMDLEPDISKLATERPYLQSFQLDGQQHGRLREIADNGKAADEESFASLAWNLNHWSYSREQEVDHAALAELLYGVEHLRKRNGGGGGGGYGGEGADGEGEGEGEGEGNGPEEGDEGDGEEVDEAAD